MTKMLDILYKTPNNFCCDQLQREVLIFLVVWSWIEEPGSSTFLASVFRGFGLNFCYF